MVGCAATRRISSVDRIDNPVTASQAGEQRDASLFRYPNRWSPWMSTDEKQVWRK
ncbi:hypothetical protein I547_2191 [Mycobacterium kansasii 824]|uniref:Uncharacterized protein n=1 Tax=Mycobacterium kansasii TaxID=1768 RepID=A0A1V3WSN1_MYCKA|nr:hypothetical protein I547_2191 [Mycobacterium kansasii 824]OOK69526.1 hypothetical protein BZL29_6053 [Mycobacterium kansasii]